MANQRSSLLSQLTNLFSSGSGGSTLGVSIGSSSIKVVEIKKAGKVFKLTHFGMIRLPEDAIANREIINSVVVTESLKQLVQQQKIKNRQVCTAISGNSVIIKRMSVEAPNLKELQDQVFWEAEQYLPFDVSEVYMDFDVVSRSKEGATDVIFVAAKKSILDGYIDTIQNAQMKAKIVDIDFFALQNVIEANYPMSESEAVCGVDIGASGMKIVIMQSGIPVFTKDAGIGGRGLIQEVERNLNLSNADAENLVESSTGGAVPQEIVELMRVAGDNYAQEIRKAIDFYNASSSGAPVAYVVLAGGASRIPELSRIVEERVGLPTQVINPFNSMSYDPAKFSPEILAAIGPIAAIPIGLALRGASGK